MARNAVVLATVVCAALTALAVPAAPAAAQVAQVSSAAQVPSAFPSASAFDCGDVITSLTCAELVPTPDLRHVRARLTLASPSSPFGVSVTADGRPLVRAAADIDGLPDAATLGDGKARVYDAGDGWPDAIGAAISARR